MSILDAKEIRFRTAAVIRKIAGRISPKVRAEGITFEGIGSDVLPSDAPRALIFFAAAGIQRLVEGRGDDDPLFKRHTIHGDSVSMVKELNRKGYVVDYCDIWKKNGSEVDWSRYSVVIDNWDNLKYAPPKAGIVKVAFVNGNHWLFHNSVELERVRWFRERTGIVIPANRQLPSVLSDEYADFLTYYGTDFQLKHFSPKPEKFKMNLCALCGPAPEYRRKDVGASRKKFMFLGSGGAAMKGFDLVIEAFARMPDAELFIGGNLREEPRFWKWAEPILAKHTNIHELGWVDTTSPDFDAVSDGCVATVCLSASEGGPASVARLLFNGQIPIVTEASNVRSEHLGYRIKGASAEELITSTIEGVRRVMQLQESELRERSDACREFAVKYHTREAFRRSLSDLIELVQGRWA